MKVEMSRSPKTTLEVYVARLFPEEGVMFEIGTPDADGSLVSFRPVYDIDDLEFTVGRPRGIIKALEDAGWKVVVDND